jgi:hypothetical protein
MRFLVLATFGVLLVATLDAPAVARPEPDGLTASDEMTIEGERATLRQAYVYLEAGDHDYHGHRIKALRAVGAACHALGWKAKGDGKNRENQNFSDNLLGSARGLLVNVLSHAEAKKQGQVIGHLRKAIQEIDSAIAGDNPPVPKSPSYKPGKSGN